MSLCVLFEIQMTASRLLTVWERTGEGNDMGVEQDLRQMRAGVLSMVLMCEDNISHGFLCLQNPLVFFSHFCFRILFKNDIYTDKSLCLSIYFDNFSVSTIILQVPELRVRTFLAT